MKRDNTGKNRTYVIASSGICLALAMVFLFAGSVVPGVELTMFALSSLFVAVIVIESGTGAGIIFYIASVILGFVIIPNKLAMIPYAFFFGYYGIIKSVIEKNVRSTAAQLIIKAAFFALVLCIGLLGFKELLLGSITLPDYPVAILIIAGILMMLLYDYIYTLLTAFYLRRIRNRGKNIDDMKLS